MSDTTTEIEDMTVDAQIQGSEEIEPWDGFLWRAIAFVVSFFPTYRNTREGRKTQKQMRAIIVVVGIILMAIGGTADEMGGFWIILGILIACLAFVIPVEELKMRSWRSTLKKKQQPRKKTLWENGRIQIDDRAVQMYVGDDRVRRVSIDRGKHDVKTRSYQGRPCLGVLPPGAKKKQSIWICSTGDVDVDTSGSIGDDEMHRPAKVDPSNWKKLWQALHQTD